VPAPIPAGLRKKGQISVATATDYPPNEFFAADGHTIIGMDADLAHALGKLMGLKVRIADVGFGAIVPGIAAGKYDLGMSSITDTHAREKTVDFVTYFSAGTSFYDKAPGGPTIRTLSDLCGYTVATPGSSSTEYADAVAQSDKCRAAGKAPIIVLADQNPNSINRALATGHVEVGIVDSPVASYEVRRSHGQLKLAGKPYGMAPYGIAVRKRSGTLVQAVLAALRRLMKNGSYTRILTKWGNGAGAITNPRRNGAVG
jgi:polar amino acid transport system substrate-binding protein